MALPEPQQDELLAAAQAVGLYLLDRWRSVCEEHGLVYHLGGGTLLGAIRDQSFIPWDDDVDVTMPRADFERLVALHHDDPWLFGPDCRLDDGRDSACFPRLQYLPSSSAGEHLKMDIFVLDAVPSRAWVRRLTGWLLWVTTVAYWLSGGRSQPVNSHRRQTQKVATALARAAGSRTLFSLHRRAVALNARLSDPDVWDIIIGAKQQGRARPSEWYRGGRTAVFEAVEYPVPTHAESILQMVYGPDWMIPSTQNLPAHARRPLEVRLNGQTWQVP